MVQAAFDLINFGETPSITDALSLSRLKGRLRTIPISQLAYLLGGIGGQWTRYRCADPQLKQRVDLIGPSKVDPRQLGIAETGGWMTFAETSDRAELAYDLDLIEDADGNFGVVERPSAGGQARILLDTYLLGDARESMLAQHRLGEELRRCATP